MVTTTFDSLLLLLENVGQVTWCFEDLLRRGALWRGAEFWNIYDAFEHLAERVAHAGGGFGRRLDEQTFVLISECRAFCRGDLS